MQIDFLSGLYCGPAPAPAEIWLRWNTDPVLLAGLALLALAAGRRRSGQLAVAALALAFVSPLCALSAALFSARVVHHVLLVAVAAPLLAIAWPSRRPLAPAPAFVVSTALLWGWHLPAAYDLALSNLAVYWTMQLTLLGSATVFWQAALGAGRPLGRGCLLILAGYMQMALLGALLTLAPSPLYAVHAAAPLVWGLMPLADQQLGGLIMWVPASLPFFVFGALLARRDWRVLEGRPA
jgi:putative membrane protein